ncbi:MAG TPA: 30S ribosomal protein S4 [Thermoflexales bacterium]|nr:30S ribosomal protein S4 [Thermoflexales bacterium]HQW34376.1 30S ribosomal protein S4 [Thermoflexales bacterium]HQZ21391.1 30S ribosomal protein S4 [Thermoflexales bacterium]HQZ99314.1 30S ribosomal protein S4 [Thermoflexales bacterium]
MARHIEPVCRLCRREGEKLFLKGSRCLSGKCAFERRSFIPGQHGPNLKAKRAKTSDYGVQLREKQKLRRIYGVLEHQFERYYNRALKSRGVTGAELLILLERRLDNVIYRAGFAPSRAAARQLVNHAHFIVNGNPVDVASYLVKAGDKIGVRDESRKLPYWKTLAADKDSAPAPTWMASDRNAMQVLVQAMPSRQDIEIPVKEQLVVEYYSR